MEDNEVREILREMLVNWNVCMELVMRDAGKGHDQAVEIVGQLFSALFNPKPSE